MLTSRLYDAQGNFLGECAGSGVGTCDDLGADLGLSIGGAFSSIGNAVGSAAKTVGKTVASAGATAGKTVYKAGAKAADVMEDAAHLACKAVSQPDVQQGAKLAATYGKYVPSYGQAASVAGYGVRGAGALCSLAYPKKVEKPKLKPVKPVKLVKPTPKPVPRPVPVPVPVTKLPPPAIELRRYPPGSFQWIEAGAWKVAIPLGVAAYMQGVLGADAGCEYEIGGKITAGVPVVAADGRRFCVITVGTAAIGVPFVSKEEGQRITGAPWYKTWKLWVVVGSAGILGTGVLAFALLRGPAKAAAASASSSPVSTTKPLSRRRKASLT